jgi:hypothetical protein
VRIRRSRRICSMSRVRAGATFCNALPHRYIEIHKRAIRRSENLSLGDFRSVVE